MRILHISTRLILGGSQENTVLSCEGQASLGHDVHLAFGPIYGPEGSLRARVEQFRTTDSRRITPHTIPHLVRQVSPLNDVRCYFELKQLINSLKPDIVHTHSSKAGILGRAAAWSSKGPMRTVHWSEGRTFHHECFVGGPPGIIHTIHGSPFHQYQPKLAHALYTASERFAAKRCHAIISVADAMTTQYLGERIGRPDQYTTIRSGMDTAPFLTPAPGESRAESRAALDLSPDDFVIGTVARLAELKGHDDLLDALAPDLKANPKWKLLWVGDGWWRERLLSKARTLGLIVAELDHTPAGTPGAPSDAAQRAQLIVTGLVPPDRIPPLIRAMDVLAHPSYREGLPRTVPQALLSGVCPVAYDVDGTREACRNMVTGLLMPPGDVIALRQAIEWCAANPAERTAMARRGREECAAAFSAETMVEQIQKTYNRVLARRTP